MTIFGNVPQPQPQSVPPAGFNTDGMYIGLPGSSYFEAVSHADSFESQRKSLKNWNSANRPGVSWTTTDETRLVDRLWRDWFGEAWSGVSWKYEDLNLDSLPDIPSRRKVLKPFKLNYQTYGEIKLRLTNTVISIKGHPFCVMKILPVQQDFKLAVFDGKDTKSVLYKDLTDLRSMPSVYLSTNSAGWLCRMPTRVYQQGMNRTNTIVKTIDGEASLHSFEVTSILKALNARDKTSWNEAFFGIISQGALPSLRLSDEVAVGHKNEKIIACYKGRYVGQVQDNEVFVDDEDDLLQEWIVRSFKEVGLGLRA